jgi:hypothetical protein|tara:strand:+ start:24 stop:392 length:369 start_codon:yes stop_codon:yes gene_type:complete
MALFSKDNMIVAWANVYASNNTIRDSYNVSSLSNDGSGKQHLNLADACDNNTYGILGTATAASGGMQYQNRGQIITCYEQNNSAANGSRTSSTVEVPYAIEYSGNNGAGAISHITIAVVGSN